MLANETSKSVNPPLFSLVEGDDYYMIALDLPTLPTSQNQIRVAHDELFVEGNMNGERAKIFSFLSSKHDVKAIYEKGVLWLTLPKTTPLLPQQLLSVVS